MGYVGDACGDVADVEAARLSVDLCRLLGVLLGTHEADGQHARWEDASEAAQSSQTSEGGGEAAFPHGAEAARASHGELGQLGRVRPIEAGGRLVPRALLRPPPSAGGREWRVTGESGGGGGGNGTDLRRGGEGVRERRDLRRSRERERERERFLREERSLRSRSRSLSRSFLSFLSSPLSLSREDLLSLPRSRSLSLSERSLRSSLPEREDRSLLSRSRRDEEERSLPPLAFWASSVPLSSPAPAVEARCGC